KTDGPTLPAKFEDSNKAMIVKGTGVFIGQPSPSEPKGKADEAAQTVTLNLVNVPTAQAAKTILSDLLGVRYTLDPSVRGEVTIQTPHPITKAAAVDLCQAALRANNAALLGVRGQYRIVPADQAVTGAPIYVEATGTQERPGAGLHIVQLKYVAAA